MFISPSFVFNEQRQSERLLSNRILTRDRERFYALISRDALLRFDRGHHCRGERHRVVAGAHTLSRLGVARPKVWCLQVPQSAACTLPNVHSHISEQTGSFRAH